MERHPDEFLVIFIEDVVSPEETALTSSALGLLRYAYIPTGRWVQLDFRRADRERDQRPLIMAENDAGGGRFPLVPAGLRPGAGDSLHLSIRWRGSSRPRAAAPTAAASPTRCSSSTVDRDHRSHAILTWRRASIHDALLERSRLCTKIRGSSRTSTWTSTIVGDVIGVVEGAERAFCPEQPQVWSCREQARGSSAPCSWACGHLHRLHQRRGARPRRRRPARGRCDRRGPGAPRRHRAEGRRRSPRPSRPAARRGREHGLGRGRARRSRRRQAFGDAVARPSRTRTSTAALTRSRSTSRRSRPRR